MSQDIAADRIAQIVQNHTERPQLAAAIIEGAARQFGHTVSVDWTSLVITPKGVHEKTATRALSDRICGLMYPHEDAGEFFHYTGMKAFRGIAADGTLRLTQLTKRLDDDEIRAHAEQHAWDGYKGSEAEALARDLFYTSFTRTTATDVDQMWRKFGDGGWGVRLRLGIEIDRDRPHRGEFRVVRYFDGTKTLLNLIDDDLAAVGLPRFLPWSASRITAFGLPESYDWESEVRLMVKHHQGMSGRCKNDEGYDFWKLPIDRDNDVASVRLLGIEAGRHADLATVGRIIQGSHFPDVVFAKAP